MLLYQAEDGIRDGHVTGVQTCALPILHADNKAAPIRHGLKLLAQLHCLWPCLPSVHDFLLGLGGVHPGDLFPKEIYRSEERRVGKAGRSRRSTWSEIGRAGVALQAGEM